MDRRDFLLTSMTGAALSGVATAPRARKAKRDPNVQKLWGLFIGGLGWKSLWSIHETLEIAQREKEEALPSSNYSVESVLCRFSGRFVVLVNSIYGDGWEPSHPLDVPPFMTGGENSFTLGEVLDREGALRSMASINRKLLDDPPVHDWYTAVEFGAPEREEFVISFGAEGRIGCARVDEIRALRVLQPTPEEISRYAS